eukprot:5729998-Pyramimonas_sp.AAC.1
MIPILGRVWSMIRKTHVQEWTNYLRRTKDVPLEVKMATKSSRDNVGATERTATRRAVCSNRG